MPRDDWFYYDRKRGVPVRYVKGEGNMSFNWWVECLMTSERWLAHWTDLGGETSNEPNSDREMGIAPPPRINEMEVLAYASR